MKNTVLIFANSKLCQGMVCDCSKKANFVIYEEHNKSTNNENAISKYACDDCIIDISKNYKTNKDNELFICFNEMSYQEVLKLVNETVETGEFRY
jgi:hypothetical protein